jgi:LPPG:FO 2-phospho-L-lactate transferase
MTDSCVRTIVNTSSGDLEFQDYFVRRKCEPDVTGFRFDGAEAALPAPGALEALGRADAVIICPSNPWVSIGPILSIAAMKDALANKRVVAVSPIIGGKAVKGPAAKMFTELGIQPTALAVAQLYRPLVSDYVLDRVDAPLAQDVGALGMAVLLSDTLMRTDEDRRRLAQEVLDFLHDNPR